MQVTPRIHMIRLPFVIRISEDVLLERFVNMFIIAGPALTLIDAGVAGSKDTIFKYIRSIGRDPAEIALLILTHSHPDHIGGAHEIRQETGCVVAAHGAERAWIEDVHLQCRNRPVPGFHTLVGGSVPVDRVLDDGNVLELAAGHDLDCVVLHTPGHSQGSVALFLETEGALITGDAVPVPGDLPVYDDVLASVRSIRRLRAIGGIRILLSSWDDPQTGVWAYRRMWGALTYLQQIHSAVIRTASGCPDDPLELCRRVAAALDLRPEMATPPLARSFSANLRLSGRPDLLSGEDGMTSSPGPMPWDRLDRKPSG